MYKYLWHAPPNLIDSLSRLSRSLILIMLTAITISNTALVPVAVTLQLSRLVNERSLRGSSPLISQNSFLRCHG